MAKIYIARNDVFAVGEHSYFVFDPDGNPNSGDERVIRGGPVYPLTPIDTFALEVDRPIAESRDALNGQDPYANRFYTTVVSGTLNDVQAAWNSMVTKAQSLGSGVADPLHPGQTMYKLPEQNYFLFDPNCNTATATIGPAGGIDVFANLPKVGGDLGSGERMPVTQYIGLNSIINSTGNDTISVGNPSKLAIYDQGGSDIYQYDVAAQSGSDFKGTVNIFEDTNSSTLDKIVLQNVDPSDVSFVRMPNGDLLVYVDGRDQPIINVHEQFDDSGVPKMNTLWIEPSGGGNPAIIPLNNPDNFPSSEPEPLGPWLPSALSPVHTVPGYEFVPGEGCPLVIDLDGDGIEATDITTAPVHFDFWGDGFAKKMGWVAADDGFLVRDLNGDGTIAGFAEMFGSVGLAADSSYAGSRGTGPSYSRL